MKVTLRVMQKHMLMIYVWRTFTAVLKAVVCIYQAVNGTWYDAIGMWGKHFAMF